MTAASRKNRILELVIDKVFGIIDEADERELNQLIDHPEENRAEWERLLERDNLMDFISTHFNDGNEADLEAAKAKFEKLSNKK
jgi:hypothetical protein